MTAFTKYQCKMLTDNLDKNILDKMKKIVTNNYTEVVEIEVLEDSYEDQEGCNNLLLA